MAHFLEKMLMTDDKVFGKTKKQRHFISSSPHDHHHVLWMSGYLSMAVRILFTVLYDDIMILLLDNFPTETVKLN